MGILKDIWNTFFGTKQNKINFEESSHNGDDFFVSNELIEREKKIDSQIKFEVSEPKKESTEKPRVRGFKNITKEQAILKHLLENGSIDKITCAQKFGLKRLDNFICELRKRGMNIVNETIFLHNEKGEKVKVNNYRLINENGTN